MTPSTPKDAGELVAELRSKTKHGSFCLRTDMPCDCGHDQAVEQHRSRAADAITTLSAQLAEARGLDKDYTSVGISSPSASPPVTRPSRALSHDSLSEWRPIETAPPYRVPVLLIALYPTGHGWTDIYHGWRNAGGSNWERWPHNFRPTHWMPLPSPPSEGRLSSEHPREGEAIAKPTELYTSSHHQKESSDHGR